MNAQRTPGGIDLRTTGGAAVGLGSAIAAVAASVCCAGPALGPLIVAWFGVGGAVWIEGLRPYSPLLIAASGLALGWSFWCTYRARAQCAPSGSRLVTASLGLGLLWLSVAIWFIAAGVVAFAFTHA